MSREIFIFKNSGRWVAKIGEWRGYKMLVSETKY